jgi:hypothetical protein
VAVDELTYPLPVANRQGPATAAAAAAAALTAPEPPVTRVFPFSMRANNGQRTSTSTPLLRGPALVIGWKLSKGGAASGNVGIALGKSSVAVTEVNVATATPLPFTPLFEGLPVGGAAQTTPNNTTGLIDEGTVNLLADTKPGLIILEKEFFLVIYTANAGAGANDVVGFVTVLEKVSIAALANFL